VAAAVALPRLVDTPRVRSLILSSASQALGRPVTFSSLGVSVVPWPSVVVRDITVADDPGFGARPFARLAEAHVRLRLWPLLSLRVELGDVVLRRPEIRLVQNAAGRWNFASLGVPPAEARRGSRGRGGGGAAAAGAVLASRVLVEDGVVVVERPAGAAGGRHRVEGLDVAAAPGDAGRLVFKAEARVVPGDLDLEITDGALGVAATRTLFDAPVAGRVRLRSSELGPLVAAAAGPQPEVAGKLEATFALGGTVGRPHARGAIELTDVTLARTSPRCPEPRRRVLALGRVTIEAALEDRLATANPVVASLAGGEIRAAASADLDSGRLEVADIAVEGVPVERVLVDFLCQRYGVTGPLQLRARATAQVRDPWGTLGGTGEVRVGPGKIVGPQAVALVDAIARLTGGVSALLQVPGGGGASPIDYESITATYGIADGVLTTRDLTLKGTSLQVAAAGRYTLASGALDFDTVVRHRSGQVRARVTGTAASPSIRMVGGPGGPAVDPGELRRGFGKLLERFR
jgi:AsmA protein